MENNPTTNHVMMVRPAAFAVDYIPQGVSAGEIQAKALQEFDDMVDILRKHDINVLVVEDHLKPPKSDAIFPASWITTHPNGHVILYPMRLASRRLERRKEILAKIEQHYVVKQYHHFEQYEANNRVLEGAGSVVFDRVHKVAYACSSERTDATLLAKLCKEIEYQPASFRASDENNEEIHHTSLMMSVADSFVVVCMESVQDGADQLLLKQFLRSTQKVVVEISMNHMYAFAGNMLQVESSGGDRYTVLSASAKNALTAAQLEKIQSYNPVIVIPIPTIEQYGGGSVGSMMVEIFLEPKG